MEIISPHLKGDVFHSVFKNTPPSWGGGLWSWDIYAEANLALGKNGNQNISFSYTGNGTMAGTLTQNSDIRLKENIRRIPASLAKIERLNGVTYTWKDKEREQNRQLGLIAQDVQRLKRLERTLCQRHARQEFPPAKC